MLTCVNNATPWSIGDCLLAGEAMWNDQVRYRLAGETTGQSRARPAGERAVAASYAHAERGLAQWSYYRAAVALPETRAPWRTHSRTRAAIFLREVRDAGCVGRRPRFDAPPARGGMRAPFRGVWSSALGLAVDSGLKGLRRPAASLPRSSRSGPRGSAWERLNRRSVR